MNTRARAFSYLGHTVDTVTPRTSGHAELHEHVPSRPNLDDARCCFSIDETAYMLEYYRLVRDCPGDIVHVHYACSLGAWLWLITACRKPLVVSTMGGDVLFDEQGQLPSSARWMTRQVLRRAEFITAKSNHMIKALTAMNIPENKIEKVVWGVDTDLFRPCDSSDIYRELGLLPSHRVILSPRILRPLYNIHLIIEALPAILSDIPEARLILTEYEADASYRERLISQARELRVEDALVFAGIIEHEKMPALYSLAEVVVGIPSSDGFPQTLLEAMACETPNVVSRLECYREVVTEGENAVFVDLKPSSIAEGILNILKDKDLAVRMSSTGRNLVMEKANLGNNVRRVEEIYSDLVKRAPSAPSPIFVRLGCVMILSALVLRNTLQSLFRQPRAIVSDRTMLASDPLMRDDKD